MQRKHHYTLVGLILLLWGCGAAQAQSTLEPHRPFAARVNLLAPINLSFAGDLTYSLPSGLGFFVGVGVKSPMTYVSKLAWFRQSGFETKAWGMYVGTSVPFSLGKVEGFSIRPSISFASTKIPDFPDTLLGDPPQQPSYTSSTIGGYVSLAYTHNFAIRFFVEPVIGLGTVFEAYNTTPRKYGHAYLQVPAQLNVGVRF